MFTTRFAESFTNIQSYGERIEVYFDLLNQGKDRRVGSDEIVNILDNIKVLNQKIKKQLLVCNNEVPPLNKLKYCNDDEVSLVKELQCDLLKLNSTVMDTEHMLKIFELNKEKKVYQVALML